VQTLNPQDRAYYEARAEAELDFARRSIDFCAAKIHYDLAALYSCILVERRDERASLAQFDDVHRHQTRQIMTTA
jgi:hypothetical protein